MTLAQVDAVLSPDEPQTAEPQYANVEDFRSLAALGKRSVG
jgi:hypothetical protein